MKKHIVFLVLSVILAMGSVSSQPAHAQERSRQEACFKVVNCATDPDPGCVDYGQGENMKVHRVLLTLDTSLRSNEIFIDECIDLPPPDGKVCVTTPLKTDGKIPAYSFENNPNPTDFDTADEVGMFKKGWMAKCLAGYVNKNQASTDECEQVYEATFETKVAALRANGYAFNGVYESNGRNVLNPIITHPLTARAGSRFEWSSKVNNGLPHSYVVTAFYDADMGQDADHPSDKISDLDFSPSSAVCQPTSFHDPYGQVFNTQTLESVEGQTVALYKDMDLQLDTPYKLVTAADIGRSEFLNPRKTNPMGSFSFVVPPGTYKILVGRSAPSAFPNSLAVNADHTVSLQELANIGPVFDFDASLLGSKVKIRRSGDSAIHTLYSDIYQVSQSGGASTDVDIPDIVEGNKAERRDIRVTANALPPRVWTYEMSQDVLGNKFFFGVANKPFGEVTVKDSNGMEVGKQMSNIFGEFLVVVPFDKTTSRSFTLNAKRTSWTRVLASTVSNRVAASLQNTLRWIEELFVIPVKAQEVPQVIEVGPRLSHIEGFAYDSVGNILPEATVTVRDRVLGVVTYTTTTDEKGFFTVGTDKLPANDIIMFYRPKESSNLISVDATKFLQQNQSYLQTQGINLGDASYSETARAYLTQHPAQIVSGVPQVSVGPDEGPIGPDGVPISQTPGINTTGKPDEQVNPVRAVPPQLLMLVAILFLLIVGAGLLIVYFMRKRQEPHLYE